MYSIQPSVRKVLNAVIKDTYPIPLVRSSCT